MATEVFVKCYDFTPTNKGTCSGAGTCSGVDGPCVCSNGFQGPICEIVVCSSVPSTSSGVCTGHGTCIAPNTCSCDGAFFGSNCELLHACNGILANVSTTCTSRGNCTGSDTCSCRAGYFGQFCQLSNCSSIPSNSPSVCSSNGDCIDTNVCSCKFSTTGKNCEINHCFGLSSVSAGVCSAHGTCIRFATCVCQTGYFGENCDITFTCYGFESFDVSNVCSGGGKCVGSDECSCSGDGSSFFGAKCDIRQCFGVLSNDSECNGHGDCFPLVQECLCDRNYRGDNCSLYSCFRRAHDDPKVCREQGKCVAYDDCECFNGFGFSYGGRTCSTFSLNAGSYVAIGLSSAFVIGLLVVVLCVAFFVYYRFRGYIDETLENLKRIVEGNDEEMTEEEDIEMEDIEVLGVEGKKKRKRKEDKSFFDRHPEIYHRPGNGASSERTLFSSSSSSDGSEYGSNEDEMAIDHSLFVDLESSDGDNDAPEVEVDVPESWERELEQLLTDVPKFMH